MVGPQNVAIALNQECGGCDTMAAADQFVISTEGPVHVADDGDRQIAGIRRRLHELVRQDLTLEQIAAQAEALAEELRQVLAGRLVAAGEPGTVGPHGRPSTRRSRAVHDDDRGRHHQHHRTCYDDEHERRPHHDPTGPDHPRAPTDEPRAGHRDDGGRGAGDDGRPVSRRGRLGLALPLAVVLAAGTCGGGDGALAETADKLAQLRSGTLEMRLVAGAGQGQQASEVGFELAGPFALPAREGALPVAELEYTRIAGEKRTRLTFVSTGEKAFVRTGLGTFRLPEERVRRLAGQDPGAGLGGLELEEWTEDATVTEGPTVDGVATERVQGPLHVVPALNDLFALAQGLGAQDLPGRIEGRQAERVEAAVRSSSLEVVTGKEDRYLRALVLRVDFEAGAGPRLRQALGSLARSSLALDLTIARPNRPVPVPKEPRALPLPPFGD